jgi:hypothetical protein
VPDEELPAERVVWVRGRVALTSCPTSYVSAESLHLLDEFNVWKWFGHNDLDGLPARVVDAIVLLESELRMEKSDAEK